MKSSVLKVWEVLFITSCHNGTIERKPWASGPASLLVRLPRLPPVLAAFCLPLGQEGASTWGGSSSFHSPMYNMFVIVRIPYYNLLQVFMTDSVIYYNISCLDKLDVIRISATKERQRHFAKPFKKGSRNTGESKHINHCVSRWASTLDLVDGHMRQDVVHMVLQSPSGPSQHLQSSANTSSASSLESTCVLVKCMTVSDGKNQDSSRWCPPYWEVV